jgi:TPR repeat protein
VADNQRIGRGNDNRVMAYQPSYIQRALIACEHATQREKLNGRFWYQLARVQEFIDPKESHRSSAKSAALGYAVGYASIGYDFLYGEGGEVVDLNKAEKNYQQAVDLGNVYSLIGLAEVAKYRNDRQKQFDYLTRYVDAGGYQAFKLAIFYRDDLLPSVPKDENKYRTLVEMGVRRGDGDSASALGHIYESNGDAAQANYYYELAVRRRLDSYAAANLAENYMTGSGVKQDFERATYWAIFAIKLGDGRGVDTLDQLMSSNEAKFKVGYGPPRSFDIAVLKQTMTQGSDPATQVRSDATNAPEKQNNKKNVRNSRKHKQ